MLDRTFRSLAVRRIVWTVVVLALVGTASTAVAEEEEPPADSLEQRLHDLEQQMLELQQRYLEEIRALKEEIAALRGAAAALAPGEDEELAELRRLAESEAAKEENKEEEETTFKARGLSLQSMNPELSVVGDMNAFYRDQEGTRERSDVEFRGLGLHLESYLDPYSRFKAAINANEDEVEFEEAYMTRYGLPGGMSATFGKFRQQFGTINRWHKHALDQFDFPLPLRQIFGGEGLNQTGVSLDWVLPRIGSASQEFTLQITGGSNSRLFDGNTLGTPSGLIRYKNYRDLSKDTYFEFGLTGLLGWRDEWLVDEGAGAVPVYDSRSAAVYGLDLNLLWEPTERMRYRNLEWRAELYYLDRAILAPDGSGDDTIQAWGGYTYLQSKLNRRWKVGTRFDYYRPDTKAYVGASSELIPHAFPVDVTQWQAAPYLTWFQSPWVRYRIEYGYLDPGDAGETDNVLRLQLIFAAGPHKHERY